MRISSEAFDLIVAEEISSEAVYKRKYRRPEWPGAQSGVTVGIGYDLGQTAKSTIESDWRGRVSDAMLAAMIDCSGKTGAAGKAKTNAVRNYIDIPWETAIAVHRERVLPRWEAKVAKALPNTDDLSPDSFGALVSLTFNRGPSFASNGERYKEMRAIKRFMLAQTYYLIPDQIRAMKRLWSKKALPGLHIRRDREADLFERGLKAAPAPAAAPAITIPADTVRGDPDIWHVQRRLKAMNYSPGGIDGIWGGLTAGGIGGFINDRQMDIAAPTSLEMFRAIHSALAAELSKAEAEKFVRPTSVERAEVTTAELAEKKPDVKASVQAERMGFWGSIAGGVSAVITGITKFAGDAVEWLNPVKELAGDVPWPVWIGGVLILCGALYLVSRKSGEAVEAAKEEFKSGERA